MPELKETIRLEAFSDGVFAIASTLLILEIKVPAIDSIHSLQDLWNELGNLWPSYFAFVFSFGVILVSWVNHHHLLRGMDKLSTPFLYANGYFLLMHTFIPFPTALLAEYISTQYSQPAIVFYCFSGVLTASGWYVLMHAVYKPKKLIKDNIDIKIADKNKRSVLVGLIVYSAITILAFWFPMTALAINFGLLISWIFISLTHKEETFE